MGNFTKLFTNFFTASASFTRPADTTAYAQYDAMAAGSQAVLTFSSAGAINGEWLEIQEASVLSSVRGAAELPTINLFLFSASVTATADNSALSVSDSDMANLLCVIPLTGSYGVAVNAVVQSEQISKLVKLGASSKNLYGLLQIDGAYTPASEEVFTVKVSGVRTNNAA